MTAIEELIAGSDEEYSGTSRREPRAPRSRRPPRAPHPPRPPKRMPKQLLTPEPLPLDPTAAAIRGVLVVVAIVLLGFAGNLLVLSHVQHFIAQQNLGNDFRDQLSQGTAPVSEGDVVDSTLLPDGAPVAVIDIPAIGVHEVVVEGTTSGDLTAGPGHRRDTVLPGQAGTSVVMGRAAAYGGPFGRIQELPLDAKITVITGQGRQTFEVIGVRYAGDPAPAPLQAGQSRLLLMSARGAPYVPDGIVRVDAQLVSKVQAPGERLTRFATLPPSARELATDTSTIWALIFALQFLLAVVLGSVWALAKVGPRKTWIVFVPLITVGGLFAADQVTRLLPNLL